MELFEKSIGNLFDLEHMIKQRLGNAIQLEDGQVSEEERKFLKKKDIINEIKNKEVCYGIDFIFDTRKKSEKDLFMKIRYIQKEIIHLEKETFTDYEEISNKYLKISKLIEKLNMSESEKVIYSLKCKIKALEVHKNSNPDYMINDSCAELSFLIGTYYEESSYEDKAKEYFIEALNIYKNIHNNTNLKNYSKRNKILDKIFDIREILETYEKE